MCAYACTAMGISARTRAPSRPWSYLHGHARTFTVMRTPAGHGHTPTARFHFDPRARYRRDQRPVSANPQPVPSRKFTEPAAGPLKCTSDRLTQIPTSNDWGAWASASATTASASTTTGGGGSTCVIVRPEGRTCSRAFRLDR